MKHLLIALVFAGICGPVVADDERSVVVVTDDAPFVVGEQDIVRLTGKGIAGSRIEAKVEGPAKVEAISYVRELKNGHSLIGNTVKEFELKAINKGKVSVTITTTSPIPGTKPQIRKIEFEIQ